MKGPARFAAVLALCCAAVIVPGCSVLRSLRFVSPPPTYQPRPIPAGRDAPTGAALRAAKERFSHTTLDEAYGQQGSRNAAWDDAALAYIEGARRFWFDLPGAPSITAMLDDGTRLAESGCDDPIVLSIHGTFLQGTGDAAAAEPILLRAVNGFERNPKYPRARAALAANRLARACAMLGDSDGVEKYRDVTVEWIVESMHDGSYPEDGGRLFLQILREWWRTLLPETREGLYKALQGAAGDHAYTAAIIGGWLYTDKAWEARGGGYADTVSKQGWQGFADNLSKARDLLTKAWEDCPDRPEAPTEMMKVTMGGHGGPGETVRLWFDRAVAAQMDYEPAYDRFLWAARPRWGGSHEAMYAFGIECLDTARFDTDVPLHFFHSVAAIADDMGGDRSVWLRPQVQRDLQRMFDGYDSHAGDRDRSRYRSMQAAVAWFVSDWQEARRLLGELGDDVDGRPFTEHFGTDLSVARAQIRAYTGKDGEQLLRAEALSRDGDCDGALSLYRAVLDTSKGDPIADSYVRERAAVLEVERDFSTGDWTSLRPSTSLTGWTPESGYWLVEPDGALRGARRERSLWIWCDADLGDRLELRGRVEFVEMSGRWADACVALRCPPRPQRDDVILAIRKKLGRLNLSRNFADGETVVEQADIGDMNTFHVYVWDDEVTVFFNDAPVFTTTTVDQHIGHGKHRIGFGCSGKSHDVVLRFRDLEVRRLPSRPSFETDGPEAAEQRELRRGRQ